MIGGRGARWGVGGDAPLDETEVLAAIESGYRFPTYFPVVIIARSVEGFAAVLEATVLAAQGEAPYAIRARTSRRDRYTSYHVELYVGSSREALDRRLALAELPGVLMLL